MKHFKTFLAVFAALLLASCSREEINNQKTDEERILSATIVIPETGSNIEKSTRTIAEQNADGSKIVVKWKESDKLHLYFTQTIGSSIATGQATATVTNISEDKKTAHFNIAIPETINEKEPYTLYCTHGLTISITNEGVFAEISPKSTLLDQLSIPMISETQVKPGVNTTVNFRYPGILQLITLRNSSDKQLDLLTVPLPITADEDDNKASWYHSFSNGMAPRYNITTREITSVKGTLPTEHKSDIAKGEKKTFVWWVVPKNEAAPKIRLEIESGSMGKHNSKNTHPGYAKLEQGYAYNLYAVWNGKELNIVNHIDENPASRPKLPIEYVTEYNINANGTDFANNLANNSSGLFNWYEVTGTTHTTFNPSGKNILEAEAFKNKYYLASHSEWRAVMPDEYIDWDDREIYQDKRESIMVAGTTANYTADYDCRKRSVSYAIRFKGNGDKYRCAYRYQYTDNPLDTESDRRMIAVVTVRYLGEENTAVTLADVAKPEYWNEDGAEYITRSFPIAGYADQDGGRDKVYRRGERGYYWTSNAHPNNQYTGDYGIFAAYFPSGFQVTDKGFLEKHHFMAIRPFIKYDGK